MESNYKHLVYYAMCESLYLQKNKTHYVSLDSLCRNMNDFVVYKTQLSREVYNAFNNMSTDIKVLYGLDSHEMGNLINEFIVGEKWLEYKDMVITLKKYTKNSYQ